MLESHLWSIAINSSFFQKQFTVSFWRYIHLSTLGCFLLYQSRWAVSRVFKLCRFYQSLDTLTLSKHQARFALEIGLWQTVIARRKGGRCEKRNKGIVVSHDTGGQLFTLSPLSINYYNYSCNCCVAEIATDLPGVHTHGQGLLSDKSACTVISCINHSLKVTCSCLSLHQAVM